MRKLMLLVVCLLMTAGAYAQSIVGQWVQTSKDSEDGNEMTLSEVFTVSDGGAFDDVIDMVFKMKDKKKDKNADAKDDSNAFRFKINCKGSWSLENGMFTRTYDVNTLRMEVLGIPEGKSKFATKMFAKFIYAGFKTEARTPERYKLISLTSDELVLQSTDPDDPGNTTFTRKK